jgi:hypothetical protein
MIENCCILRDDCSVDLPRRSYDLCLIALVKYIVGESENCSDNLFECFSTRFAEDSSPKLERSEIRCQFVF